jgi:hypothetical protein
MNEQQANHQPPDHTSQSGSQTNEIATKLKLLEERYTILRKKSQLSEQNLVEMDKEQFSELRLIQERITDMKRDVKTVIEQLGSLHDEMQNFTRREEFIVLKRYVDLWQPTDFVTRKEVNNFLRKRFEK